MNTMNHILVILFAAIDSKLWSSEFVSTWADHLIVELKEPQSWLLDLSVNRTVESQLDVVREAMGEFFISLPDHFGDLLAGMILLRYCENSALKAITISELIDAADAYGVSGFDIEAVANIDLNSDACLEIKSYAKQNLEILTTKNILENARNIVED